MMMTVKGGIEDISWVDECHLIVGGCKKKWREALAMQGYVGGKQWVLVVNEKWETQWNDQMNVRWSVLMRGKGKEA